MASRPHAVLKLAESGASIALMWCRGASAKGARNGPSSPVRHAGGRALNADPRSRRSPRKSVGDEACAADQRAIDIRDREQLPGVRGLDRAAVEDADRGLLAPCRRCGAAPRGSAHAPRRRRPGSASDRCRSPRPARRRSTRFAGFEASGTEPRSCRRTTLSVLPASRSPCVSPTQTIAVSPARCAASALARTVGVLLAMVVAALGMADDDVGRAGVGEHLGREVAREGARTPWRGSPGRRSATREPSAARAKSRISVAGGQTRSSTLPRSARRVAGRDIARALGRGAADRSSSSSRRRAGAAASFMRVSPGSSRGA